MHWLSLSILMITFTTTIAVAASLPMLLQQGVFARTVANVIIPEGAVSSGDHFVPQTVTVAKGTTVEWTNNDTMLHTVISGTPDGGNLGTVFDSSYLAPGKTYKHTFNKLGTFNYYCTLHPSGLGKVVVSKEGDSGISAIEKESPIQVNNASEMNLNDTSATTMTNTSDIVGNMILLSQKLRIGDGNYNNVVGEVKNIGKDTAASVKIGLTTYDKDGGVLGTDETFTRLIDGQYTNA